MEKKENGKMVLICVNDLGRSYHLMFFVLSVSGFDLEV
jgi:hypothetical protein